jgi:hypothetical protein
VSDIEAVPARPEDEAPHLDLHDDDPFWSESYYLDFFDVDRGVGGYVRLAFLPNLGRCWYWACLVGPDRPLVTVIDHDVAMPAGRSREIRSEGLWADYTVETPLDHVTVGVEAFAVALDDPAETYGSLRGERVPFGLDLEWETDGGTYAYPGGVTRYEVPCRVHGEVLVGQETINLDGWGQRDHSWGNRDWWAFGWSWTAGRFDDGTRFHGTAVNFENTHLFSTGYVQPPGQPMVATDQAGYTPVLGDHGMPTSTDYRLGDLDLTIEPVAFSPVRLVAPDGRISLFPRAWTTFTDAEGRRGHGWTEWNQPQPR